MTHPARAAPPLDPERVSKILVVSLDNLGDLVFASALFPPLAERFPGARLGVWCKTYTADIAALIPKVSVVIAADPFWDRAPGRGKGRLWPFARSVAAVRRERFDVAVLASAPWRTAAATALSGIPVRVGRARRRNARWLTHVLAAEDRRRPVLAEMERLLDPLGVPRQPLRYALDPAPLEPRQRALARALPDAPVAVLHAFASKRDRCVPLREWAALARALAARDFAVLWAGSAGELDEVRALAADDAWRYVDRLGDGSLADTAALLSGARLFVGHDSGPMHVAAALGVPTVGVFAPGEPSRTFPQGVAPSRVVAGATPGEIGAAAILDAVDALVGRAPG